MSSFNINAFLGRQSATSVTAQTLMNNEEKLSNLIRKTITARHSRHILNELNVTPYPTEWLEKPIVFIQNKLPRKNMLLEPAPRKLVRALIACGFNVKGAVLVPNVENGPTLELRRAKVSSGTFAEAATLDDIENGIVYGVAMPMGGFKLNGEDYPSSIAKDIHQHLAMNLIRQISELKLEDKAKFAREFRSQRYIFKRGKNGDNPYLVRVKPDYARSYTNADFVYESDHSCYVKTNRVTWVNGCMSIGGELFSAADMMTLFLVTLTADRKATQRQVDGFIAATSALWTRSDGYGEPLKSNDVLSFAIAEQAKSVYAGSPQYSEKNKDQLERFPFFILENNSLDLVPMMEGFMKEGTPVTTDKYAMEVCIYNDGMRALMEDMFSIREAMSELAVFAGKTEAEVMEMFGAASLDDLLLMSAHDRAKASKELNRKSQAFLSNFASSWDPEYPLTASSLRIGTSIEDAIFRGFKVNAVISNSLFGNGSGACSAKPDFYLPYSVPSTINATLNAIQIPKPWQDSLMKQSQQTHGTAAKWFDMVIPTLEVKCKELVGKHFTRGEEILVLWPDHPQYRRVLATMRNYNQDIVITDYSVTRNGTSKSIDVKLFYSLVAADNATKLRGPGIKCTVVREPISILSYKDEDLARVAEINEHFDLLFPYEALKGRLAQVFMYVNAMGGGVFRRGKIYLDNGDVVDLSTNNNQFQAWVNQNTLLVKVRREIAKSHYDYVMACNLGKMSNVKIIEEIILDGRVVGYTVDEICQILYGNIHVQVEVSTPRENTGTQSMLLEELAILSVVDYNNAVSRWMKGADYRESVIQAVNMTFGAPEGTPIITDEDWSFFADVVYHKNGSVRSGSEIMWELNRLAPEGIVFATVNEETHAFFLIPAAFAKLGSFSEGGAATGLALDICEMMHIFATPPEGRGPDFNSEAAKIVAGISRGLDTWAGRTAGRDGVVNSKSVLKRLARTDKNGMIGKIQTSHHWSLENEIITMDDGSTVNLPVIMLHPDCDIVKVMGLKNGDLVQLSRSPMVSKVWCYVKVSAEHGLVAYARTLPETWAHGNQGDTDGDGMKIINDTATVTYQRAERLNKSVFGPGGYWAIFGEAHNHPFADFVSVNDSWKKKIINWNLIPAEIDITPKEPTPIVTFNLGNTFVSNAVSVSGHYRTWVGVAYGWCSILSFKLAEMSFDMLNEMLEIAATSTENGGLGLDEASAIEWATGVVLGDFGPELDKLDEVSLDVIIKQLDVLNYYKMACAQAWFNCYEDKGLSGYSPEADTFFNSISYAVRSRNYRVIDLTTVNEKGEKTIAYAEVSSSTEGIAIQQFISTHYDLPIEVATILIEAEEIRTTYRRIENRGINSVPKDEITRDAIKFGALRRLTQGSPMVDSVESRLPDIGGNALFQMVLEYQIGCSSPILADALESGISIHNDIMERHYQDWKAQNSVDA